MQCWHCQKSIPDFERDSIPFKATCDACSAYLHCCVNCKYYKPGRPNDCLVPNTEHVRDRQSANYCEEFSLQKNHSDNQEKPNLDSIERGLFKEQ